MFLCEIFSKVKLDYDGLNMAWFLLHLFGLFANFYACASLKNHWNRLSNLKILLATSIFANMCALSTHVYLPINHMLSRATGLQWNFGEFFCSFFPPASNLALSASILSFSGIIIEQYYKRRSREELSAKAMENTVVMIWVCAAFITAPQFCNCGSVSVSSHSTGVCLRNWQNEYQGMLYDSVRLVLQYAFPIGLTACSFFKDQILQMSSGESPSRLARVSCGVVNILAACFVGAVIYVYPVNVMKLQRAINCPAIPDVEGAIRCMEFLAVLCCVAVPFEIEALVQDEVNTGVQYKRISNDDDDDDEILLVEDLDFRKEKKFIEKDTNGNEPDDSKILV